ncbi:hypothetical protein [Nocardia tengchongensis]|uniref:hypothetical protein n=1 Tax=Nocardia tengchongensis TaxID=2055889 RepID=UPI0036B72B66
MSLWTAIALAQNSMERTPDEPRMFVRGAVGITCALLAPAAIVPAAAVLLAFGHHSDPTEYAPTAVLVSNLTPAPCVMFCDEPPRTSDSAMPKADPKTLCPPFCEFERW